jgi:NarL family two-component system sensor histidine kinase LiaS
MAQDLANFVGTQQELAMLEERNRLALELHDSVKQHVFAIAMKLGFAESLANNDALKKTLHDLGELAHQTQDDLQRLIHELKPLALEHQDLTAALKDYVRSWENLHTIKVSCTITLYDPLTSVSEQALFRVVQEGLANIAKHAQAQHVSLILCQLDNDLVLSLQDDGCGFNLDEVTRGFGRHSMLERMSQLGGSFNEISKAGEGTKLEVRLPLERNLA